MKFLLALTILTLSVCCSFSRDKNRETKTEVVDTNQAQNTSKKQLPTPTQANEIPPNGKYTYATAFAEWDGKSMGAQVTVVIQGASVQVIYDGVGNLTAEKGEILDEGILRKHKSGQWLITTSDKDLEVDEIGGCTGGPSVIDFENKKFWMC